MKIGTSLKDLDEFQEPVNIALSQADIPWPCPQNRVIVTNFGTTFDHKQCVGLIPGASFKNCRLSAYTARFYDPGQFMEPTGQGFTSGLYVSMGTNSERVSLLFIHIFRGIISNIPNLPKRPRNSPMFVCNKVSSGVYDPLDILNFEKNDGTRVVCHRKSFSGVIYKRLIRFIPYSVKLVSISVFESGNYIVMNVEGMEAQIAFIYFLPILQRNKLNKTAKPTADQLVTFIRQQYLTFDPSKESITECVKTAIANAEKAVVTREQIIQRTIQNASRIQENRQEAIACSSRSSSISIRELEDDEIVDAKDDDVIIEDDSLWQLQPEELVEDDLDKELEAIEESNSDDDSNNNSDNDSDEEVIEEIVKEEESSSEIEDEEIVIEEESDLDEEIIIEEDEFSTIDHHSMNPIYKPHFVQPVYDSEECIVLDSEDDDSTKKQRID